MKYLNKIIKGIIPLVNKIRIVGILLLSCIFISAIANSYYHNHHIVSPTLVSMSGHAGHGNGHEAHEGSSKSNLDSNKLV